MNELEEVDDVIEELTTTGKQDELENEHCKKLKRLCQKSQENLKCAYEILTGQLEQNHAEIRYSAFQVIDQLFTRSHLFRELIVFNLQNVFILTMETDKGHPLPPPTSVAKKLKKFALSRFYQWYQKYGKGYRKLELGFEFLRDMMKVKFKEMEIQTLAEQERQIRDKRKEEGIRKNKLQQVDIQIYDQKENIFTSIKEIENCFQLAVEKITDNETEPPDYEAVEHAVIGNEAGISSHNFTVSVEISKRQVIYEDADNEDFLGRLRELFKEIQQHEKVVKRWLQVLVKCSSTNKERIQELLTMKNALSCLASKFLELDIKQPIISSDDDEDEDGAFIDVPEKQKTILSSTSTEITKTAEDHENIPSTSKNNNSFSSEFSTTREKHLQVAPFVPFDSDLKYWESDKIEISSVKYDSLHRFWKTNEHQESFVPSEIEASMRERSFLFEGKFEPVQKKCRALLPTGKLCERMDREKCPFHGRIVERDWCGRPLKQEDIERDQKLKRTREEEQRKQIEKDIEASIGISLSSKKRKYKKTNLTRKDIRKTRYNRLTKLKGLKLGEKSDLKKKIFSVRSLDRISNSMKNHTQRKHLERFGSNFNYP